MRRNVRRKLRNACKVASGIVKRRWILTSIWKRGSTTTWCLHETSNSGRQWTASTSLRRNFARKVKSKPPIKATNSTNRHEVTTFSTNQL